MLDGQALQQIGDMRAEFLRRAAFVREPHPEGVRKPALRLFAAEFASLCRVGRRPAGEVMPTSQPQTLMLVPGFGAHPRRMKPMADALAEAGHEVHDWGLGVNFGPTEENFAFLMRRVGSLARAARRPVTLVGWSLGGLYSREIARRQPENVARVITMGTPFSGDPRANNAWKAYQVITGHRVDAPPVECELAIKPPVPTVALWSPRDGVIDPRAAKGWPHERDRAVAVRCTHIGFASDPRAIAEVARQLEVAERRPSDAVYREATAQVA